MDGKIKIDSLRKINSQKQGMETETKKKKENKIYGDKYRPINRNIRREKDR